MRILNLIPKRAASTFLVAWAVVAVGTVPIAQGLSSPQAGGEPRQDEPKDKPKDQPKDDPKDQPKDDPKDQPKDEPKDQHKDEPKDKSKVKEKTTKRKGKAQFGPVVDPDQVEAIDPEGILDKEAQGKETRLVLWRAGTTWHLRAHATGSPRTFEGTIVPIGGPLRKVEGLGSLEAPVYTKKGAIRNRRAADEIEWRPDRIKFRFGTRKKGVEGLDIEVSPEMTHLQLNLRIDGHPDLERIFIGSDGSHPTHETFILKASP